MNQSSDEGTDRGCSSRQRHYWKFTLQIRVNEIKKEEKKKVFPDSLSLDFQASSAFVFERSKV